MSKLDTTDVKIVGGKFSGERITRVPVGYLHTMVRNGHAQAEYAQAEIERRGTKLPDIEISMHAVDRASLRCDRIYRETRNEDEGIQSWLARMAQDATQRIDERLYGQTFTVEHRGLKLVFNWDSHWPVLVTVQPAKRGRSGGKRS